MKRLLKRFIVISVLSFIAFGTFLGYLGANSGEPRESTDWIRLPNMPDPRGEFTAAVAGQATCPADRTCGATRIIVAGGLEGLGKPVATVSQYDPVAQEWSSAPAMPEPRHHAASASVGSVMYVSGGSEAGTDWKPETNFWSLLPNGEGWKVEPEMPEGRMGHQMVAIGSKMFVIGGRGPASNVLIFDTLAATWSMGAEMPGTRDHLAVAVVGSRIFAIGGRDSALLPRVDIYDTLTDSWSEGPPLPRPMSGMAAGALADGLHVVGGEDPKTIGGRVFDLHYRFSPETLTWETAPRALMPVHGAASVVYDGSLVIIGGSRRQGSLSVLGWTGLMQAYAPTG